MRSNYKKLGRYIKEVNKRNTELKVDLLLGVSIKKVLMPSIANTVGTDMTTYKIINRNQFAYGPVTSRNGNKISVAILEGYDEAIISQAYVVFEVINPNELLPEYLMMWFRRPEFDRYARYKSHGSAREIFDWQEMCEVELPIPPIEKQREIVSEYQAVQKRIQINEQLIQKLEETAQAVYRRWFVEFEFPDEEGNPYKSSGGEMVWCEELRKEVPEGWEVKYLENIIEYKKGYAFKSDDYTKKGNSIIRVSDLGQKYIENSEFFKVNFNKYFDGYKVVYSDLIITTVGSWPSNPFSVVGKLLRVPSFADGFYLNQNMVRIRPEKRISEIIYQQLMQKTFSEYLISGAQGSANQASITLEHTFQFRLIIPNEISLNRFFARVYDFIDCKIIEDQKLTELKELLLSKLATIEN